MFILQVIVEGQYLFLADAEVAFGHEDVLVAEEFLQEFQCLVSPSLAAFVEPDPASEGLAEGVAGEDLRGTDVVGRLEFLEYLMDAHAGEGFLAVALEGLEDEFVFVVDVQFPVTELGLLAEGLVDAHPSCLAGLLFDEGEGVASEEIAPAEPYEVGYPETEHASHADEH